MERTQLKEGQKVSIYFFDGIEVRKREGDICFVNDNEIGIRNRGILEIFPKSRLVRTEVV